MTIDVPASSSSILPRNVCPTTCAVCGDVATGYHYDVPACHGCKAFFRRSITAQRTYHCGADGKCYDSYPTKNRNNCRACRLAKCLSAGMNSSAIQSMAQAQALATKRFSGTCEIEYSKKSGFTIVYTSDELACKLIESLLYVEYKGEKYRKSNYNPDPRKLPVLDEFIKNPNSISVAEKMGEHKDWPLVEDPFHLPVSSHYPDRPKDHTRDRKNWMIYDLMGSIEYAKTFPYFHKLSDKDKKILIRGAILTCLNLMQAFYSYANDCPEILHPDGTPVKKGHIATESHRKFVTQNERQVVEPFFRYSITRTEYVLLKAIFLCNPAVPGLSDRAVKILAEERESFSSALLSQCLKSSTIGGAARYASILGIVSAMENRSKLQKDTHLVIRMGLPPHLVVPFLDDILD